MADRPEMFGPTRGFSEMADSMEPCKILWANPYCRPPPPTHFLTQPISFPKLISLFNTSPSPNPSLFLYPFGLGAEIQSPTGLS